MIIQNSPAHPKLSTTDRTLLSSHYAFFRSHHPSIYNRFCLYSQLGRQLATPPRRSHGTIFLARSCSHPASRMCGARCSKVSLIPLFPSASALLRCVVHNGDVFYLCIIGTSPMSSFLRLVQRNCVLLVRLANSSPPIIIQFTRTTYELPRPRSHLLLDYINLCQESSTRNTLLSINWDDDTFGSKKKKKKKKHPRQGKGEWPSRFAGSPRTAICHPLVCFQSNTRPGGVKSLLV